MEQRYRILMVDDIVRYHRLYELAITEALPAKVYFATNGEEALAKLAAPVPFDLLILDLNMPKMGGEETLRRIRLDANLDNLPVIILTGDTDQDTHRRLLDLGADDFVEKGSPPEIFVARLKNQLRHKLALDRVTRLAVDMDIFAAGVLHDIRNLETNILMICELARAYLADDPVGRQEQMLLDFTALEERADSLGRYAAAIIRMVRETHQPLELKPQNLAPLLDWMAKMAAPAALPQPSTTADAALSKKPAALSTAAGVSYRVDGNLAPVVADQHFLQLALLNIAQNAVKYARPGHPPELIIRQRPGRLDFAPVTVASIGDGGAVAGTSDHCLVTCIQDNGIGIKKQDLRKVFEPFTRGFTGSQQASGFGLGLALVQKVITTMGGRVWAELPEGHAPGTVLCIELPAAAGG